MEFRDYLLLLRLYRWVVVGLTVVFFALGYLLTSQRPPIFEASITFTVEKPQATAQATSSFYQYDEYYSQLAATIFADTIANWLRSPGPVVEIYDKAGLPPPTGNAAQVGRTFRIAKGEATSVITVTVRDSQEGNAAKIIESAKAVINAKVEELRTRNNDPSYFVVAATQAQIFEFRTSPVIIGILGAITGFIISVVAAFALASLTPRKRIS